MQLIGDPEGLVTFSGEQLWSHLDALARWGEPLSRVHLIVAHGDDDPGGPVERLEGFIRQHLSHVDLQRFGPINDDDPVEARDAIMAAASENLDWLIDLSGGTRLMFTGGVIASGRLTHAKTIYRQSDGPWYQLGEGRARALEGVDDHALDKFSVRSLIDVTWADSERKPRVHKHKTEPEVSHAAQRTLNGRPWREQFHRALHELHERTGKPQAAGHLFESFVLSLVRHMGVEADDVARGVTLLDGTTEIQEVDIVVNSHGRLHVIDCKLSDLVRTPNGVKAKTPPLGTQIREAFTTKRLLGDGGDQFIFLRPYATMREEFRSLCEEYGLVVVDKTVLARTPLPVVLANLIRPPSLHA